MECVHPAAGIEEQSRWVDVIAVLDESSSDCAREEMSKICLASRGVVEEVLAQCVDEKMLRACEIIVGDSLIERAEARVRVVEAFREKTGRLEESQEEVSRLRAECADLTVRIEEEQAKYRELKRRHRTAQNVADVVRSACASRTAEADTLRAALEDADLRLEDETRRAVIAEHSRLYDEDELRGEIGRLEERARYDAAKVEELASSRINVEMQLAAERAKRKETEQSLEQVYRDLVAERSRSENERARADEAVEKYQVEALEEMRQENLLLRGKVTALEHALLQEEREKISFKPPSWAELKTPNDENDEGVFIPRDSQQHHM